MRAGAPAFGFINGASGEREPAAMPVLDAWRKAGQPLGNHGWSHQGLSKISDDVFADEGTGPREIRRHRRSR